MRENHVVIEKAKIRLYTDSKKSAYDLKDNASDFLRNVVFKIIEDYLRQYETSNGQSEKMTVFNHLKLNFTINENHYKGQFAELSVAQEIQKQLDVIFYSSSPDKSSIESNAEAENKISYSEADMLQNSFIYFLEKGRLPWYCNEELRKQLFTEESIQLLLSENRFIDRFLNICQNKTIRRRFVSQLEEEIILNILNLLFYRHKSMDDSTIGFLIFKHSFFSDVLRKDKVEVMSNLLGLWYLSDSEEKIQKVLNNTEKLLRTKSKSQKTIDQLMALFKSDDFYQKPEQLDHIDVINEEQFLFNQITVFEENESQTVHEDLGEDKVLVDEIPKESITPIYKDLEEVEISIEDYPKEEIALTHEISEAIITTMHKMHEDFEEITIPSSEVLQELINPMEEIVKQSSEQLNKQLIANAGLIIIHPFLKTFFGRLGLLSEISQLKDPELCVHLLHYLATGVEQDYEYQLSFEKLLCGIPQEISVERFILLTEEMKQEAEGLLRAVLDNWPILRNSGTELLRHEFLKREGLVDMDEKNIQISFERKMQDILIDKLEWTLSFIKLPWLDKIIRVNW